MLLNLVHIRYMASIIRRGEGWRAQVRRKGFHPLCRTFETEKEAREWGHQEEQRIKLVKSGKTPEPSKGMTPYQVPGVYLLFLGRELQYIGRSVHIYRRLNDHHRAAMPWDHFKIIPTANAVEAAEIEQSLISKLQPPWNSKKDFKQRRRTRTGLAAALAEQEAITEAS